MLIFASSNYLWLLLLVPLMPLLYALVRHFRRRRMLRLGDEALVQALMPSYSYSKGWARLVLFDLAFMFFVIGLARPQIGAKLSEIIARFSTPLDPSDTPEDIAAKEHVLEMEHFPKVVEDTIVERFKLDRKAF